jgi:hypothetical protein
MHHFALLKKEVVILQERNKKLSRRRRTKNKRLYNRKLFSIQEAIELKTEYTIAKPKKNERRKSGRRTKKKKTRAQRCKVCGKPGHNARISTVHFRAFCSFSYNAYIRKGISCNRLASKVTLQVRAFCEAGVARGLIG